MANTIENTIIIKALEETKKELKSSVTNEVFWNEFVNTLKFSKLENNTIFLLVKNLFAKEILTNDLFDPLSSTLNKKIEGNFNIAFVISGDDDQPTTKSNTKPVTLKSNTNTNKNLTFENFFVSNFNKLAFNAANTILKTSKWNPIFIYGGVGVGKTHLLHAIGNAFTKQFPDKNVRYVTTDDFIRETYDAFVAGGKSLEEMKSKYQSYDLLLIDDIQFLSKKEKMNEIFFNIFNHNVGVGKFIMLTSDKPPNQLNNFEDRMKSRFGSGLTIKITPPDISSMVSIAEKKIAEMGVDFIFNKEAIHYIIHRSPKDIRQMEGLLNEVLFYAINDLPSHSIISVDVVRMCIEKNKEEKLAEIGYDVDPNIVIEQISKAYNVEPSLIKSKIRTKQITQIRNVCMYALRNKFKMSLQQIGSFFEKHHTTVMEGIENIEKLLKKDEGLHLFVDNLFKNL